MRYKPGCLTPAQALLWRDALFSRLSKKIVDPVLPQSGRQQSIELGLCCWSDPSPFGGVRMMELSNETTETFCDQLLKDFLQGVWHTPVGLRLTVFRRFVDKLHE